jgi:hypothetical protein
MREVEDDELPSSAAGGVENDRATRGRANDREGIFAEHAAFPPRLE